MINVLQVLGSLKTGGAECRMMEVYRHIDKNYYHFDFLILSSGEQYFEKEVISLGGQIYKIKMPKPWTFIQHILQIKKILQQGNYDVVHAHTSYHCGLVMVAAWCAGVVVRISHARTTSTIRKGVFRHIMSYIGKLLVRLFTTHRLAISKAAGVFLFGKCGFEIVPNAIDIDKYLVVTSEEAAEKRKELHIPEDAFIIGQIGRFDPMKNHNFTLHWFKQFHAICPKSILVLVGDGPMRNKIATLSQTLGLEEVVRFTGVIGDVEKILQTFQVLFFPSLFEGLGGVVLEAQAAGILSVISDTLPTETDLGLGLVKRCSLHEDMKTWNEAVLSSCTVVKPSNEKKLQAFHQHHYSLDYEVGRLSEIYSIAR